jgi:hypothetical protein
MNMWRTIVYPRCSCVQETLLDARALSPVATWIPTWTASTGLSGKATDVTVYDRRLYSCSTSKLFENRHALVDAKAKLVEVHAVSLCF